MKIENLHYATVFLVALSIATERLTEIVKTILVSYYPSLQKPITEPTEMEGVKTEAKRQVKIQGLAAICGIIVSLLSYPLTESYFEDFYNKGKLGLLTGILTIISIGLLSSGTSGLWNNVYGAISKVKTGSSSPPSP